MNICSTMLHKSPQFLQTDNNTLQYRHRHAIILTDQGKETRNGDLYARNGRILYTRAAIRDPHDCRGLGDAPLTNQETTRIQSSWLLESQQSRVSRVHVEEEKHPSRRRQQKIKATAWWQTTIEILVASGHQPRLWKAKLMTLGTRYPFLVYTDYASMARSELYKKWVCIEGTCVPMKFFPTHFERNILNQHLRHARNLGLSATLTMEQWGSIVDDFNHKCAYCRIKPYSILEHFIPLSLGGGTTAYNCVPACQSCNVLKANVHPSMEPASKGMTEALQRVQKYLEIKKNS